jgi:hypothetical protein
MFGQPAAQEAVVNFEEMEKAFRQRLEALPPAARAELIHVIRIPDLERVERIGAFWGHPQTGPSVSC